MSNFAIHTFRAGSYGRLSLLIVALLAALHLSSAEVVQNNFVNNNLSYTLYDDGTATLNGAQSGYTVKGSLILPSTVTASGVEYTVTKIASKAFASNSYLSGELVLPEKLVEIGSEAFHGDKYFSCELKIPSTVKSIGMWAFRSCSGFKGELKLPEGIVSLGANAFGGCTGFTGELRIPTSLTNPGEYPFAGCKGFTSLVLPEGLTKISMQMFDGCTGLTGELIIPSTVTEIGDRGFAGCTGFTGAINIPDGVVKIDKRAFEGCTGFTSLSPLPASVADLGEGAFMGCTGLKGSIESLGSIKFLRAKTFMGCTGLDGTLTLPNTLMTIFESAFNGCVNLKGSLEIPEGVGIIQPSAFFGCSGFDGELKLPSTLTTVGEKAFSGCSGFKGSLTIPAKYTRIEPETFYQCAGFDGQLNLAPTIYYIGERAFYGCSGFTGQLKLPQELLKVYTECFAGCTGFTGELVFTENIRSVDAGAFAGCTGFTGNLVIADNIRNIYSPEVSGIPGAFEGCTGITGLSFGSQIYNIGNYAFRGCTGIKGSVIIPDNVTGIGVQAFKDCSSIEGVMAIPAGTTKISASAFVNCSSLTAVRFHDNLEEIGSNAFAGCSKLEGSLTFPASLSKVGATPFDGCNYEAFVSLNPEPPEADPDAFSTNTSVKLFVPTESLSAYRSARGWGMLAADMTAIGDNVTAVELDVYDITIPEGQKYRLDVTILSETVTSHRIVWKSSDQAIATVNVDGTVSALSSGMATITVNCGLASTACAVNVIVDKATVVELNATEMTMPVKESNTLVATVRPVQITDKTVTWESSDPSVATVDADGKVTGVAIGTATITATCGEVSGSCQVTVTPAVATGIELSTTELSLTLYGTGKITATVKPDHTTDKTVKWESDNSAVVSVTSDGSLRAISLGTATVTATCGDVSAFCRVTVNAPVASSIQLNVEEMTIPVGVKDRGLTATILPEDSGERHVQWTSSNRSVATIATTGMITAINEGETIITAVCGDAVATCKVTVMAASEISTRVVIDGIIIDEGTTARLTGLVTPAEDAVGLIDWQSTDPAIATVADDGTLVAIAPGTTTVVATNGDASPATFMVTVNKKSTAIVSAFTPSESGVSVVDGEIRIPGNDLVEVYDLKGVCLARTSSGRVSGLPRGIYILRLPNSALKVQI